MKYLFWVHLRKRRW